ncbi:unnamed protein product, partial [marine sediment metagenome]
AFGSSIPIVIVPAMHESMYHSIIEKNITLLKEHGIDVLGPRLSEGKAKISKVDDVIDKVLDLLITTKDLEGKKILITAGPSREAIDDIRYLSNKSSGRMGIEIAKEASARGAEILLVAGECMVKIPDYINTVHVESANDFIKTIKNELTYSNYDIFISAAAISDYKPTEYIEGKISSDEVEEVELIWKLNSKVKKAHFILLFPNSDKLMEVSEFLVNFGDINKDGRPVLRVSPEKFILSMNSFDKMIE